MQKRITISLILLISIVFFVLGLLYPLFSTKQQVLGIVLKYKEVRLFDSIRMFYESNDYLLSLIILLFTIILPIIKFIELTNRIHKFINIPKKINNFLHFIDKWSMLDVFLVALLLLNFKMDSNIIVMKLKIGTTFIALSVIIRMLSSNLIEIFINHKTTRL
ncbi:MAG: paraquat-inducible protein A [Bacteroidetes bacterium]|nr:paraquat-inducible protein A [Bacteroidota bacterium]